MPKSEKMRTESRNKILEAAMGLFVARGYHETSTRDIMEAAGMSKGLLYNYFASKEAILEGLIDLRTQNISAVIGLCKVEGDPAATVKRFIQAFCGMLRRDRAYLRFRTALVLQPGIPGVVTEMIANRVEELMEAIVGLFAEAQVAEPRREAFALMAKLDGLGLHYLGVLRNYPLDEMETQLIEEYEEKYRKH